MRRILPQCLLGNRFRTWPKYLSLSLQVCRDDGVPNTPLNPYLYEELLNNHPLWLDGSKLEKETGFEYQKPELTRDVLVEVLQDFVNLKMFPPSMVQL